MGHDAGAEFNDVETTFVLPPADPAHTARVRIFTPDRELAFAGHRNLGTAFLIARERVAAGERPPSQFLFEEAAGLVVVDLLVEGGHVVGAELLALQPLARGRSAEARPAAACLGLMASDVRTNTHSPTVVSVGLPFLVMQLASGAALRRARLDRDPFDALLPLDGAQSVYAYVRGEAGEARGEAVRFRVLQGEDMRRPRTLLARSTAVDDGIGAHVGGRCVAVFTGPFELF